MICVWGWDSRDVRSGQSIDGRYSEYVEGRMSNHHCSQETVCWWTMAHHSHVIC